MHKRYDPFVGRSKGLLLGLALGCLSIQSVAENRVQVLHIDNWGSYIEKESQSQGVMSALVKAAFAQSGIDTSLVFEPWSRIDKVNIDRLQAVSFGWIKNDERQQRWLFSDALMPIQTILVKRSGYALAWQSLKDLEGHRIGVTRGYSYGTDFDDYQKHLQIEQANTDKVSLQKLLAERVDVVLMDPLVANTLIRNHFKDREHGFEFVSRPPVFSQDVHVVCSKSNTVCPEILEQFNTGLLSIRRSGQYEAIVSNLLPVAEKDELAH